MVGGRDVLEGWDDAAVDAGAEGGEGEEGDDGGVDGPAPQEGDAHEHGAGEEDDEGEPPPQVHLGDAGDQQAVVDVADGEADHDHANVGHDLVAEEAIVSTN